jgi:hypothetical protein
MTGTDLMQYETQKLFIKCTYLKLDAWKKRGEEGLELSPEVLELFLWGRARWLLGGEPCRERMEKIMVKNLLHITTTSVTRS